MTEYRSYLQKYAMHFGTYMGVYWILKFILFPLIVRIPFFGFLFVILTLAVPFIGYHYAKMYRDKICRGSIQFLDAVLFCVVMYMFASLLVAVVHYIYFQFIDHGFFINSSIQILEENINAGNTFFINNKDLIERMIDTARTRPINITFEILSRNVLWGSLLAFPTALMVMKKGKAEG